MSHIASRFSDGHIVDYQYDAAGKRLGAYYLLASDDVFNDGIGVEGGGVSIQELVREWSGEFVYENGELERILTDNGYWKNGRYWFYVKDWQGNNRVTVGGISDASATSSGGMLNNPTLLQAKDVNVYYPYGTRFSDVFATTTDRYQYSGKEFDRMNGLDLYDFHARQYDPVLGRFTTPDPHSEKYYHISPYAYCASNPLRYIDPTGMELNLAGSSEDIKSVLDIYNKGMGYKCKTIVDEKNKVSLIESDSFNQMSKQEKLYYGFLKKSIKSENTININVTRDSEVVIGDVKSQKIDIGDIERIGDGEWVNSSSVLLHETVEQHNIQSSKMPIVNAHINAAESAEYSVTNVYPDPINRLTDYNGVMSIYIYNNNKKEKQIGIVKIKIDLTSGNIINKEEEKCE
ncbi:MAG: RHS repeat-associated core domain-containing protein [Muribaculaceae bacterium]|nr:RHS repeat-associated core domain-containing protein [Muribaculaceae bacterium]